MATNKESNRDSLEQKISVINKELGQRYKKEGPSIFIAGKNLDRIQRKLLPTGNPALDRLLGGGIPTGVPIELSGNPASGKTWLAASIIKQSQARFPYALFINTEGGFPIEAMEFFDVDLDKLLVCDAPQTGSEALDAIVEALESIDKDVGIVVLDSVAGLMPKAKLKAMEEDGIDVDTVGRHAKLMSDFFPRVISLVGPDRTFLLINQEREQISTVPMPRITTGGNAVRYYCKLRLQLRTLTSKLLRKADLEPLRPVLPYDLDQVDKDDVLGQTVVATVLKANAGPARQFDETTYRFIFDVGYDIWMPIVEEALDLGIIQSEPGYRYTVFGEKLHGKNALLQYLLEDNARWDELRRLVESARTDGSVYQPVGATTGTTTLSIDLNEL